jgi:hypothetical protein
MICPICEQEKDASKFNCVNGKRRHNACYQCRGLRERAQLKLDFLIAFDFKCSCCGLDDGRFLTLDHVKDDGNLHREKYNEQQILRLARKEGYPKDKYDCLCFNCNSGRSANGGICPHKCITKEEYKQKLESRVFYTGREFVNNNTSNLPEARKQMALQRSLVKSLKGITPEQLEQLVLAASQKLA